MSSLKSRQIAPCLGASKTIRPNFLKRTISHAAALRPREQHGQPRSTRKLVARGPEIVTPDALPDTLPQSLDNL